MTTVVALHKPGFGTVIGSDRLTATPYIKSFLPDGKWFVRGRWAAGFSGYLRQLNVVENHVDELFKNLETPFEFTIRISELYENYKVRPDDDHGPADYGSCSLLVTASQVWEIDSGMAIITVPSDQLASIGSGGSYATGAGYTAAKQNPVARVRAALEAACYFDPGSGGEPWIATLKSSAP